MFVNQILDKDNITPVASLPQGVVFGEVCIGLKPQFISAVVSFAI